MRQRINRHRGTGHSIMRVFMGLRGTVREARKSRASAGAPQAKLGIAVGKPHSPEQRHKLDVKLDEHGMMVFASMGEERERPKDIT